MKKLIVAFLLVFASSAQAQFWKRDNAHAEHFITMAPVDSLDKFWEYGQPKVYEQWWHEIADCEHIRLPESHTQVRFFEVNGAAFIPTGALWYDDGVTYPRIDQIYLATPYVFSKEVVMHEMLHWIIWADGYRLFNDHPIEMFETCGIHRLGP